MGDRPNRYFCPDGCALLLLALLEDGDKSGLRLLRDIERRTDGAPMLSERALYPVLHGMEMRGDIHSYERESADGRPRRYYQLTRQGNCTLSRRRREWERLCRCFGMPLGGERFDRD